MAYLPDLSAPASWELEQPRPRGRAFSVVVALFFALLLAAASAAATAVYLDGVHVRGQLAFEGQPGEGQPGAPVDGPADAAGAQDGQSSLDAAFVSGRKAGYKRGLAAGKLQADRANKKAVERARAQGLADGREEGERAGYSHGYQDASQAYQQAWDKANPTPGAGADKPTSTPTP